MKLIGTVIVEEWCDLDCGYEDCVLDGGDRGDCPVASGRLEIEKRDDCEYWRRDG